MKFKGRESGDKKNVLGDVFFIGVFFLSKSDEKSFFRHIETVLGCFWGVFIGFYGLQMIFEAKEAEKSQKSLIFQIFQIFCVFFFKNEVTKSIGMTG